MCKIDKRTTGERTCFGRRPPLAILALCLAECARVRPGFDTSLSSGDAGLDIVEVSSAIGVFGVGASPACFRTTLRCFAATTRLGARALVAMLAGKLGGKQAGKLAGRLAGRRAARLAGRLKTPAITPRGSANEGRAGAIFFKMSSFFK